MNENFFKTITSIILLTFFLPSVYQQVIYGNEKKLSGDKQETFLQIQEESRQFFDGIKKANGRRPGLKQYKRWEWFARTRLNQEGYFNFHLNQQGWLEKEARFGPVSQAGGSWIPLGPSLKSEIYGLGRINCIEFDPNNSNKIWVGAPTGGLWRSLDGGQSWTTLTDHLPNIGISDILIHPQNSDIMYIATGDKQRGSMFSLGIMKSLDGGNNWEFTELNPGVTEEYKIGKLLMHPHNPDIIIAATNKGIYKTTNGGENWIKKISGNFFDLEVHSLHSSTWYATGSSEGIYRSTDSGDNWNRLTNGLPYPNPNFGRIAISLCAAQPDTIFAVYSQDVAGEGWRWGLHGVYRSTDGGDHWTLQANHPNLLGFDSQGIDFGGQGGYALIIEVNPMNPDEVYVGSVHLWRSLDGGITWHNIGAGVHVDHHDFSFLPGSTSTIFTCNDGGVYKSTDKGETWVDISDGLAIHQVYRLDISQQIPHMIIVGSQDNGTSLLSRNRWRYIYGGDGTDCIISPNSPSTLYFSWQFGHFLRSDSEGQGSFDIFYQEEAAWIAPIVVDPMNPNTLYTATRQVYKTTDAGNNWQRISHNLTIGPIRILAKSPSLQGYLYASDGSQIFKGTLSGENWTQINTDEIPDSITDIVIHPQNPEVLWVSVGGYGRWNSRFSWFNIPYEIDKPKIFYSDNAGSTWNNVSGILPNIPVNCLAVDPYTLGIYAGTDLGVFYSPTGIGDWQRFDKGLPNIIVTDIKIHKAEKKIIVGTYGRGVWESSLASIPDEPGIYPPLNFTGQTEFNRSLLSSEVINLLSWEENHYNQQNLRYRLFLIDGHSQSLLAQLNSGETEYWHRGLASGVYQYKLVALDGNGNESEPLYLKLSIE